MSEKNIYSYYLEALKLIDTNAGEAFVFNGIDDGLKMVAEYAVRFKYAEIATMIKTPNGTTNILSIPSGYFTEGFNIDDKISSLFTEDTYLVLTQYEKHLNNGNYLILKITSDAEIIKLYEYLSSTNELIFVSRFDPAMLELPKKEVMVRLMKLAFNELNHLC